MKTSVVNPVMSDDKFLNAFIGRLLQENRLGPPTPEGTVIDTSISRSVGFNLYDLIKFREETEKVDHFTVYGDPSTLRYFDLGKVRGVSYFSAFYLMKNNLDLNEQGKGNLFMISLWSNFGKEDGPFVKVVTIRYVFHCSQKVSRGVTYHEFKMNGGKFGECFMSNSRPDAVGLVYDYIRLWFAKITSAEDEVLET